jgi:hypothetical protein
VRQEDELHAVLKQLELPLWQHDRGEQGRRTPGHTYEMTTKCTAQIASRAPLSAGGPQNSPHQATRTTNLKPSRLFCVIGNRGSYICPKQQAALPLITAAGACRYDVTNSSHCQPSTCSHSSLGCDKNGQHEASCELLSSSTIRGNSQHQHTTPWQSTTAAVDITSHDCMLKLPRQWWSAVVVFDDQQRSLCCLFWTGRRKQLI